MVEKKVKVKERHKRVAEEYEKWLAQNPKADKERRMKAFDALADSAVLAESLNAK